MVLIINVVKKVKQDKNTGFLEQSHIDRIYPACLHLDYPPMILFNSYRPS